MDSTDILRRFANDDIFYAETFVRVVDMASRDHMGELVPFRVSAMPMQRHFVDTILKAKRTRVVELKARRVGGTTLFQILGMVRAMRRPNFNVALIAQNEPEALKFGKAWRQLVEDMVGSCTLPNTERYVAKPEVGACNDHYIEFPERNSNLTVGTAGSVKLFRGQRYSMIIGTEVSKWDIGRTPGTAEETWAGAQGALDPGGLAILESTAYGAGGFFYDIYDGAKRGTNGWTPVFYDWRWHPLYALSHDDPDTLNDDRGPILLSDDETALNLSDEQARWRRFKIATMPGATTESKIALFLQEYPEDDITCFATSGSPLFDIMRLDQAIRDARPPLRVEESGGLTMWQLPRVGAQYIIGVDPGGDISSRASKQDFASATVIDQRGNHVASLHGHWDTVSFGSLVAQLGTRYNDAMLVVESGPYGDAVLLVLATNLHYPHLYAERDLQTHKIVRLGKRTTQTTKPAMADNAKELFETGGFHTDDKDLLGEMRNFQRVRADSGYMRLEAIAGHDDRVMSALLGLWAYTEGAFAKTTSMTKILTSKGWV